MTKFANLASHDFYRELMDVIAPILSQSVHKAQSFDEIAASREAMISKLNSAERVLFRIFQSSTNLSHVVERLGLSQHLLPRSPISHSTKKTAVNRNDWTDYNFYVYVTSLASLLDLSLILSANVYGLGLPPRFCTFEILTQHDLLPSPTKNALKSMKHYLMPHTQRRHGFVHRGEQTSFAELTDANALWRLRGITFVSNIDPDAIPPSAIKSLWRAQLNEIRPKLLKIEAEVSEKLNSVLDSLLPALRRHLDNYRALKKA